MKKLTITVQRIAEKMVDALADAAARCEPPVSLVGVTAQNFNSELDKRFNDGGETRCERFVDVGWEYANQFGRFRDDLTGPWHEAHQRALAALKLLAKRFPVEYIKLTPAQENLLLAFQRDGTANAERLKATSPHWKSILTVLMRHELVEAYGLGYGLTRKAHSYMASLTDPKPE